MKYNHIFYPRGFYPLYLPYGTKQAFFLGVDKGRAPYIASLKHVLEEGGLACDIRILSFENTPGYREHFEDILTDKKFSYGEYLEQVKSCHVLLDINQAGQNALTMRVMEAIYLSQKLITNKRNILTYDFYDPDNIIVLPEESLPSTVEIQHFLRIPFRPYPDSVLKNYSFEHWLEGFAK